MNSDGMVAAVNDLRKSDVFHCELGTAKRNKLRIDIQEPIIVWGRVKSHIVFAAKSQLPLFTTGGCASA
jgi:hypothetical protein